MPILSLHDGDTIGFIPWAKRAAGNKNDSGGGGCQQEKTMA